MKVKSALWMITCSAFLIKQVLSACFSSSECDPRCDGVCAVINDQNSCCDCVDTYTIGGVVIDYYFWKHQNGSNGARCGSNCPTKYYKDNDTNPHQCSDCADECQ